MKSLAALIILVALTGCIEARNPNAPHSCSEQVKCCGCAGTQCCQVDADGHTCCSPGACSCREVTKK